MVREHQVGVVTLATCEDWANTSLERTRDSLAAEPDGPEKDFALALFEPKFEVEMADGSLVIQNSFIRYEVTASPSLSAAQATRVYSYDRINSYRKAMLGQLPPFQQLEATRVMESKKITTSRRYSTIRLAFSMTISET